MPVSPWAPTTPVVSRNPLADTQSAKKRVSLIEEMDEEVEEMKRQRSRGRGGGRQRQQQQKQKGAGEGWRRRMRRLEDELEKTKADADALRARLGEARLEDEDRSLIHSDPYQQECLLREEIASEKIKSSAAREEVMRWKDRSEKMESAVVRLRGELEEARAGAKSAREVAEARRVEWSVRRKGC